MRAQKPRTGTGRREVYSNQGHSVVGQKIGGLGVVGGLRPFETHPHGHRRSAVTPVVAHEYGREGERDETPAVADTVHRGAPHTATVEQK